VRAGSRRAQSPVSGDGDRRFRRSRLRDRRYSGTECLAAARNQGGTADLPSVPVGLVGVLFSPRRSTEASTMDVRKREQAA